MKKLPIAKAVFKDVIEENCCYVDKTKYIKMLEDYSSKYLFISRPRRFGKSLFVDTLRAAYSGEKELFKGLYLEDNWDWDKKYPIISIDWGNGTVITKEELDKKMHWNLLKISNEYDIKLEEKLPTDKFEELIIKLYKKYGKVVILIDEYDKPIIDNLKKPSVEIMRETLGGFYSVLKGADKYLKLVFLTGVSKFTRTSIFSKLNNLKDLTYSKKYSDMFGYTQEEFEDIFVEYLDGVDLKKVKEWYDGYKFRGSEIYNPYDILLFLDEKEYDFYWFETGTPTLLINEFKNSKKEKLDFDNISVSKLDLQGFDINNIKLEILLLQTGYLTIDKEFQEGDNVIYKLKIPNLEVRMALNAFFNMDLFDSMSSQNRNNFSSKLYHILTDKKPWELETVFKSFFESIPHDWYRKNDISKYEGYYHCLFYTTFNALGFRSIAEDSTQRGNIDLTVFAESAIYIFEFKMSKSANSAMAQIKQKKYYEKYLNHNKPIYLIGIAFQEDLRNISDFEYEELLIKK